MWCKCRMTGKGGAGFKSMLYRSYKIGENRHMSNKFDKISSSFVCLSILRLTMKEKQSFGPSMQPSQSV